jgi:VWFA-related protein
MLSKSAIALVLLLPLAPALAQSGDGKGDGSSTPDLERLTVDVDVVDVFFVVKDKKGRFIADLRKEDFELAEDGEPQEIRYFSAFSEQPLELALMIDTSGSMASMVQQEQRLAIAFLRRVLAPADRALVVSFDSGIQLQQDYTNLLELLEQALQRTRMGMSRNSPELSPAPSAGRGTALYDAIESVSRSRFSHRRGRKAMILLTDGQDNGSHTSAKEAMAAAARAEVICYVLLLGDRNFTSMAGYVGVNRMRELSERTGGRLIPAGNERKLERSFKEISEELRRHYSIGYTPINRSWDGRYRSIKLRARNGYRVQSRRGYYADPRSQVSARP